MNRNESARNPRRDDRRHPTRRTVLGAAAAAAALAGCSPVLPTRSRDDSLDVVVVGAGLSGLVAARDLRKAGVERFRVLEARDRVGGRTMNVDIGRGAVADLGGQWVGRSQTAVLDLLRELGMRTISPYLEGKIAFLGKEGVAWGDFASVRPDADFSEAVDALAREIPLDAPWNAAGAVKLDGMTVADWLATRELPPDAHAGLRTSLRLTFGAAPEEISFLWFLFYVHSSGSYGDLEDLGGGAQEFRIEGGAQAIGQRIADALGDRVTLGAPVLRIDRGDGSRPCTIATDRETIRAERVILALSPSQAEEITFDPPLPASRAALQASWPKDVDAMKLAVVYDAPFWREEGLSGHSLFAEPGIYEWAFDNSPPDASRGVLGCFVSSPEGTAMEPAARHSAVLEAFTRYLGERAKSPLAFHEQYWSHETYTRGCVSPLAPGVLTSHGASLRPSIGRLEWAGTETAEIWNGYMDGAVRAGHAAALRTLRQI